MPVIVRVMVMRWMCGNSLTPDRGRLTGPRPARSGRRSIVGASASGMRWSMIVSEAFGQAAGDRGEPALQQERVAAGAGRRAIGGEPGQIGCRGRDRFRRAAARAWAVMSVPYWRAFARVATRCRVPPRCSSPPGSVPPARYGTLRRRLPVDEWPRSPRRSSRRPQPIRPGRAAQPPAGVRPSPRDSRPAPRPSVRPAKNASDVTRWPRRVERRPDRRRGRRRAGHPSSVRPIW